MRKLYYEIEWKVVRYLNHSACYNYVIEWIRSLLGCGKKFYSVKAISTKSVKRIDNVPTVTSCYVTYLGYYNDHKEAVSKMNSLKERYCNVELELVAFGMEREEEMLLGLGEQ